MQPSQKLYQFIRSFEGYSKTAYKDAVGIWTIGFGTIKYPDGTKVQETDSCTQDEAEEYLEFEINEKAKGVNSAVKETPLNQGQYDSLVSFSYNLGVNALKTSTLLKKLLKNPHDTSIYQYSLDAEEKPVIDSCEFLKWVRAGGKPLAGLIRRRAAEADMYAGK